MYYNTVNDLLKQSLQLIMASQVFEDFRLVGGTSLSLQLGHRISIDIDLFSDAKYGTIDFTEIEIFLKNSFSYIDSFSDLEPALGRSYLVGTEKNNAIKLDIYYTDAFIQKPLIVDGFRLATIEEIIAMKIDVVQRGGRKKDFWDLHELLPQYEIQKMLDLHEKRYPYNHNRELILEKFLDFTGADHDFDPICLHGKYWEFVKDDIEKAIYKIKSSN